jgi:hypothetical protein
VASFLSLNQENPSNNSYTVPPAITSRLSYGFSGALGVASQLGQSHILRNFSGCKIPQVDIDAAAQACKKTSLVYPSASLCYNATMLLRNWKCPACFEVELHEYGVHDVKLKSEVHPQRAVTPHNYLVSGILIEQVRSKPRR